MNETLEREGFEERLLVMLRDAVSEPAEPVGVPGAGSARRPFFKRARIIVVAATLALLTGVMLLGGLAIGGRQVVNVDGREALHNPSAVEQQLRDAGIDATIVVVPLPSIKAEDWEGRWWWLAVDQPEQLTQDEFARLYAQVGMAQVGMGGVNSSTGFDNSTVLELPKMPGHITLFVGRTVPAGQPTVSSFDRMNELSPAGAFYCLGIDPNDPSALGAALVSRGYHVIWNLEWDNAGKQVASPPSGTVATWAWLRGPDLVDVRLAAAGRWAVKYQVAEGTFPPGTTPPWTRPCG